MTLTLPVLSIGAQMGAGDIPALKARGIKAVICNRPDGEEPGQPRFEEIATAARAAGLEACYVPVDVTPPSDAAVRAFRVAMESAPGPVFAYCRSGARATQLARSAGVL